MLSPLSCPFSLLFSTNTANLPPPRPPSLPPPPYSRPVAQRARLTWYFTGGAPSRGQGRRLGGHRQPPSVWRGVLAVVGGTREGRVGVWGGGCGGGGSLSITLQAQGSPSESSPAHFLLSGGRGQGSTLIPPPAQSVASGVRIF